ncbi:hypothetical protein H6761_03385 [Candidatus Nomurabacteria bacterium]|nr:hypothetical protein [Candidatus Nomurabacteria bacterium]
MQVEGFVQAFGNVGDLTSARSLAGIEFPRGRVAGQSLDVDLSKAGDAEVRVFLAGIPDEPKQVAYRKAEKEAERLIEVIRRILEEFPELDRKISKEDIGRALDCALTGASRAELVSGFALRILRKANVDMSAQVAQTSLLD